MTIRRNDFTHITQWLLNDDALSTRLATMARQLSAMDQAGELDPLPADTRFLFRGLALALSRAAEEVIEMAIPAAPDPIEMPRRVGGGAS